MVFIMLVSISVSNITCPWQWPVSPCVHQQLTVASVSYMENLGVMIAPWSYLHPEVMGVDGMATGYFSSGGHWCTCPLGTDWASTRGWVSQGLELLLCGSLMYLPTRNWLDFHWRLSVSGPGIAGVPDPRLHTHPWYVVLEWLETSCTPAEGQLP